MAYMKFVISLFLCAAVTCEAQTAPLPQIRQNGAVKQFFVDDKPFIMLSGELHNSSASSIEYMLPGGSGVGRACSSRLDELPHKA